VAQSDCRKSRRHWPLLEKGQELELCGDTAAGGDNGMGLRASYVGLSLASPSLSLRRRVKGFVLAEGNTFNDEEVMHGTKTSFFSRRKYFYDQEAIHGRKTSFH
jgi:hypothetical protein